MVNGKQECILAMWIALIALVTIWWLRVLDGNFLAVPATWFTLFPALSHLLRRGDDAS